MKNFSDYINSKCDNCDNNNFDEKNNCDTSVNKDTKHIEELLEKYESYSNDDLMNEFIKMTIQKKKEGALDDGELNILKNTIIPYLNDEQKENLEKLLDIVKNV